MRASDTTQKRLLLNCDLGEGLGPWSMGMDEAVMPLVDMANIACGFHASDPLTMTRTVRLAQQAGARIGAHPGYPDLVGFGRRSLQCSHEEIVALVRYQVGALDAISRPLGTAVSYVKPHGALYNDMMGDQHILRAVLEAVAGLDHLPLMVLASADNSTLQSIADEYAVPLLLEAFADRAYDDSGLLVPRHLEGAVYHEEDTILNQARQLLSEGVVTCASGRRIPLRADSLCVHGDNPESVRAARAIRSLLDSHGETG